MSWLSKATGIHLNLGPVSKVTNDAVNGLGHAAGSVLSNPITKVGLGGLLAATGVGAPLGAAIMGGAGALGGALKPGGNLGSALGGAATGAVGGYGAGKLGDALYGGLGAVGSGTAGAAGAAGHAAGGILSGVQKAMGVGGGAGGWLPTAISTLGGLAGGALDARQQEREYELRKGQIDYNRANDTNAGPLKLAVIQALLGRLGAAQQPGMGRAA